MKQLNRFRNWGFYLLFVFCLGCLRSLSAATSLVNHSDLWRFHKGTNAPQTDWQRLPETALNVDWGSGNGGFGYGDSGLLGQSTVLSDMQNRYTTVYLRHSITLATAVDAMAHLQLTVDYDDGYVAHLDGVEITRSTTAPAGLPLHTAVATDLHEASCCDASMNPASVLDLGVIGNRLAAGVHVLAIQGFNESLGSSDFHLIVDLAWVSANECPPNTICTNTTWHAAEGPFLLTADTLVGPGAILTIEAGTQVRFLPGISLRAGVGGGLDIQGTEAAPVTFAINTGTNMWGELAADGTNSFLTVRHAEVVGGAVKFRNGAMGLLEDCYVHDYKSGITPIAGCTNAKGVTVRRSHFSVYHETLWQYTPMLVEDSLFENPNNPSSDALDFDGVPAGSIIRRCTFRHGPQTNTDAIDLGSGTLGVVVEDCLMYDFPNDKGVSIGENSFGIIIRNCLIYGCDSGVAVKDNCTAVVHDCTFVNNDFGFRNYNKANPSSPTGGGHVTESYNNILWDNLTTVSLLNSSTVIADHSNYSKTNWSGLGNVSVDPQFVDAAQRDYRLPTQSPLLSSGRNGNPIGTHFPVGAPMTPSHPSFTSITADSNQVRLRFWVDSEKTYSLLASESLATNSWIVVTNLQPTLRPRQVELHQPLIGTHQFLKLVAVSQVR